jgi:hypothetical protein
MKIKIFMASAANILEREILMAYGKGIQLWIDQQNGPAVEREDVTLIGRWRDVMTPHAHVLEYDYNEGFRDCDLAVIFGSWKPREKGTHLTRTSVATSGKNFVCIETPLLKRVTRGDNQYYRTGINGFLCRDASWPRPTPDSGHQRLAKLGVSWPGWRNNQNGHILLALQLPGDASLRGMDINDWALRTIQNIRGQTDRFIVVRSHPLASQRGFETYESLAKNILLSGIQHIRFSDGAVVSWEDDLNDAYCTVTFTSGLAVDSVCGGVPTIACDPGNFAWGISSRDVMDINQVRRADDELVRSWLANLSYCQWSLDEMRSGEAWRATLPSISSS